MPTSIADTVELNNGVQMPWLGLGVWKVKEKAELQRAVAAALSSGYRSIDTAAVYGNEEGVGLALRNSGLPREELFITTKLWNADQGYESALAAFEQSRRRLGLDYIDLYLIHWPVKNMYKDSWRAMVKLYEEGYVRAIGVSNFQSRHLEALQQLCPIIPAVNQIELHPRNTQKPLLADCRRRGIQVQAWSPLMRGQLMEEQTLQQLSTRYNKSIAQIILRWNIQQRIVTIPKSVTPQRIAENSQIFDFELTAGEMAAIDQLNEDLRTGKHPDEFDPPD
ncbi:aldo/keto reductase [Paenibacillus sp. SYP-B4298]|uniref:aldo/keto reductase n=1 Tax=Paenibacillus sp. SYP-B4298 TaxID=2996034 RepID=UPI0022DD1489|nr:aldo/keto reductase [Paenibacillus sp. SYP-B4298]